jgi:hypothetical protein
MSAERLPEYFRPDEQERGQSLGLDDQTYRQLAKTGLAIIKGLGLTIGLYRLEEGCGLDIFGQTNCLTIVVDCVENQVFLAACPMDGTEVFFLLRVENCESGWRKIRQLVRAEVTA